MLEIYFTDFKTKPSKQWHVGEPFEFSANLKDVSYILADGDELIHISHLVFSQSPKRYLMKFQDYLAKMIVKTLLEVEKS